MRSGIHPRLDELLTEQSRSPAVRVDQLTPSRVRADELAVLDLQTPDVSLHAIQEIVIPRTGQLCARVYRPAPGPLRTLIYFHGGGFVIDGTGYDRPLRELALATGCLIVAPNVRLAPEHRYPAAAMDAIASVHSIVDETMTLAGCAGPIGIGGDSSGGNLAAVATHALTRNGHQLDFQVLIYPMLDATASSPSYSHFGTGYGFSREKSLWYFDQYLPADINRRNPQVSPLFESHLGQLPPTLVISAEFDPLRDDAARYVQAIQDAGGDATLHCYEGMIHGFFQLTGLVESAHRAQAEIARWLQDKTLRGVASKA